MIMVERPTRICQSVYVELIRSRDIVNILQYDDDDDDVNNHDKGE